jgi:hypothetical protein
MSDREVAGTAADNAMATANESIHVVRAGTRRRNWIVGIGTALVVAIVLVTAVVTVVGQLTGHQQVVKVLKHQSVEIKADSRTAAADQQVIAQLKKSVVTANETLEQVLSVTGPKARASSAKSTAAIIRFVVVCEENHAVRDSESTNRQHIIRLVKGCPDEPLAKPVRR